MAPIAGECQIEAFEDEDEVWERLLLVRMVMSHRIMDLGARVSTETTLTTTEETNETIFTHLNRI